MTVANGHAFVEDTLGHTLAEIAQVLGIGPGSTRTEVADALSREPAVSSLDRGAPGGIRVIDDGMWSAFYQRELAHVALRGSEFYRDLSDRRRTPRNSTAESIALLDASPSGRSCSAFACAPSRPQQRRQRRTPWPRTIGR